MASSVLGNGPLKGLQKNWIIAGILVAATLIAIAVDTTVVVVGSRQDIRQQAFSPDVYGRDEFPKIRNFVIKRGIEAATLATELVQDKKATIKQYATISGAFPIFPVKFSGVIGNGKSGIFEVQVKEIPPGLKIRVQTGPAINGTELRDIPGNIKFGAFTNQIEYQDVGAEINKAMSTEILSELDRDALIGEKVSIVGAFKLINPKNWLITPVEFEIQ